LKRAFFCLLSKPLVLLERQALPCRAAQGASRSHFCKEASCQRRQVTLAYATARVWVIQAATKQAKNQQRLLPKLDSPPTSRKPRELPE
jgi:hypothetical protein